MKPTLLIVASMLAAATLGAQTTTITTDPEVPSAGGALTIRVNSDWGCPPASSRLEIQGRRIDIIATQGEMPCPPAIWNWEIALEAPPLEAGIWQMRALAEYPTDERTLLAGRELRVHPSGGEFSIHPRTVPERGGMLVRIAREGIGSCPSSGSCQDPVVRVNATEATLAVIDRDSIDFVVPPQEPGAADVRITGRDGATTWTLEEALYYFDRDVTPDASIFERILVPVMFAGEGAFGSQWTTELRIFNSSRFAIDPQNVFNIPCQGPYGCPPQIPAGEVMRLGVQELFQWNHGYVLAIPQEVVPEIDLGLHIRDLSRQDEGWGTEIPLIPASRMSDEVTLLDVPLDRRYRRTLRIFGIDGIDGAEVNLTWHFDNGHQESEKVVLRTLGRCAIGPCWLPEPSGAVLSFDPELPAGLADDERIRVEVRSTRPFGAKIWAFVSLTNNETQQVTTVTPQP